MATKIKHQSVSQPQTEAEIVQAQGEARPAPQSRLTLEIGLYAVIVLVGVALRVWNLGAYPLAQIEAQQSLVAFHLYQGDSVSVESYSPLLVSLNSLVFLLFHDSDTTARLATVLLGVGLILLPFTLRRQLGARVCLLASALLAISPTAMFLSRTLNSEIAVAVGGLMIVSGFFNWVENGQRRWLYLAAAGLAVLLTAGPMAYSIILVFALVFLLQLKAFKTLWGQGLNRSAERQGVAPIPNTKIAPHQNEDKGLGSTSLSSNTDLQQAGIFLLVALILLATAATFNVSGLGVTTNLFAEWIGRFGLQAQSNAGFNAVFLLTIYEPLLVVAGLIGLAYAILDHTPLRLTMVGWFVGALLLDLVMGGRPNGNVILSLVPLAFLAALALAELWAGLQQRGSWNNEGIILGAGLVITVVFYIELTGWLALNCQGDEVIGPFGVLTCNIAWLPAVGVLVTFPIILVFFWQLISGGEATLRGAALTGVAVGLLATLSIGWRLNYGPLMNLGYQPLAGIPASTELVALDKTLANESVVRAGDKTLLDITLINSSWPALLWQFRDYEHLTQVNSSAEPPATSAVITPTPTESGKEFGLDETYIGQDFAINQVWSPVGMQPRDLVNWLIYREAGQRPENNKIVLWLRLDGQ